jgi:hypothetical protein
MSGRDVQKGAGGKYHYPRKQIINGVDNQDIIKHLYDRVYGDYAHMEKTYANSIVEKLKKGSADGKIMVDDVEEMIRHPPA